MKPAGYYLGYSTEKAALQLYVHVGLLPALREIPSDSWYAQYYQKQFSQFVFEADFDKQFGFYGVCTSVQTEGEYRVYSFTVPQSEYSDEVCDECKGTGQMRYPNEDLFCYFCKGSKKKGLYKNAEQYAICLTLSMFFKYLEIVLGKNRDMYDQHAVIVSAVLLQRGGMGVGGGLSSEFMQSLANVYDAELGKMKTAPSHAPRFIFDQAEEAMLQAWLRMKLTGDREQYKHELRAELNAGGMFYIEVPGENGCSLSASNSSTYFFEEGKPMGEHNVDTPTQQIGLLVGFAKMYEEIIAAMQNRST